MSNDTTSATEAETFFREYTSPAAVAKYSRATAGCGISYLLDHDYKEVYLEALHLLPADIRQRGIRILGIRLRGRDEPSTLGFSVDSGRHKRHQRCRDRFLSGVD